MIHIDNRTPNGTTFCGSSLKRTKNNSGFITAEGERSLSDDFVSIRLFFSSPTEFCETCLGIYLLERTK